MTLAGITKIKADNVFGKPPCAGHEWGVMHHFDDEGRHYCPTMFVTCRVCFATGLESEPYTCELWGEFSKWGPFR